MWGLPTGQGDEHDPQGAKFYNAGDVVVDVRLVRRIMSDLQSAAWGFYGELPVHAIRYDYGKGAKLPDLRVDFNATDLDWNGGE